MLDPRITALAQGLVSHSTALQPGEHVLIEAFDIPEAMVIALVRAARERGGHPHVAIRNNRVMRALIEEGSDAQFEQLEAQHAHRAQRALGRGVR